MSIHAILSRVSIISIPSQGPTTHSRLSLPLVRIKRVTPLYHTDYKRVHINTALYYTINTQCCK